MKRSHYKKLIFIKLIHTAIWIFFNIVIGYMAYSVVTDTMDRWFWLGYVFVLIEGLVLLFFHWTCPLTILARKYSTSNRSNFDIYLPEWLAHYTKTIYTSIMGMIVLLTIYRMIMN